MTMNDWIRRCAGRSVEPEKPRGLTEDREDLWLPLCDVKPKFTRSANANAGAGTGQPITPRPSMNELIRAAAGKGVIY